MVMDLYGFEYGGLDLNDDEFGLQNVDGLDSPDLRVEEITKAEAHGAFVFSEFSDARRIILEGDLMADIEVFEDRVTALRQAFNPRKSPVPLRFFLGDVHKRVFCKPARIAFVIDREYSRGYARWTAQLLAEDPRIYSEGFFAESLEPFDANGLSFPLTFDVSFGGGTGGHIAATNEGTFDSPPITRIDGPVANPKVTNMAVGRFLRVGMEIPAGQYLILNHADKTVMLNGVSSRYSRLSQDSKWWALRPGSNTIRFDGDVPGGAAQVTVSWRHAWL